MDFPSFAVSVLYAVREMGPEELPGVEEVDRSLVQVALEARREGIVVDIPVVPEKGDCPLCARCWGEMVSVSPGKVRVKVGSERLARIAFFNRVRGAKERAVFKRMAERLFDMAHCFSMVERYDSSGVVLEDRLAV